MGKSSDQRRRSSTSNRVPGDRPRLRKAFGQHHLRSGNLCRPIVELLGEPTGAARLAVEIGPGGGVLTRELLARGFEVLAIELDREWAFHLGRPVRGRRMMLVVADALKLDWARVPVGAAVVGNLPYQISTALIGRLLARARAGVRAAFLVQREVAERLVASPGSSPYGALSVMTAARGGARVIGRVAPGSFQPPPKVESTFIALELAEPAVAAGDWEEFELTVRAAFRGRRKTVRNSLAQSLGRAESERLLALAGIDGGARAQDLSVAEFEQLHRARQAGRSPVGPRLS